MEYILGNSYKVKLISKNDDEDLLKALKIYNDETPPEIKTDTNQILQWIEYDTNNLNFKFMIFVIYLDEEVIGFSEIAYFHKIKTASIDYITFKNGYRVNAVFFAAFSLIQNFMESIGYITDYWLSEISYKNKGQQIDKESSFLKKLISMENFGMIDMEYYQPSLGELNYESSFEARLYVKSKASDDLQNLSKLTVLSMVETIYYSYYLEWYRLFLSSENLENYKKDLDISFQKIKNSISKDPILVSIETFKNHSEESQKTSGSVPAKKIKNKIFFPLIAFLLFLFPLVIFVIYYMTLKNLGFEVENSLISILGPTIGACLTAVVGIWLSKKI